MSGSYDLYPVQLPIPTNEKTPISFIKPNSKIYTSEALFPNKMIEIVSDEFYLGYRILTIRSYPYEYLPKRNESYTFDEDITIITYPRLRLLIPILYNPLDE